MNLELEIGFSSRAETAGFAFRQWRRRVGQRLLRMAAAVAEAVVPERVKNRERMFAELSRDYAATHCRHLPLLRPLGRGFPGPAPGHFPQHMERIGRFPPRQLPLDMDLPRHTQHLRVFATQEDTPRRGADGRALRHALRGFPHRRNRTL